MWLFKHNKLQHNFEMAEVGMVSIKSTQLKYYS